MLISEIQLTLELRWKRMKFRFRHRKIEGLTQLPEKKKADQ